MSQQGKTGKQRRTLATGKSLMLSKRNFVLYLEHARVIQQNERVVYLVANPQSGGRVEQYFNIPDKNTVFVLLGKGTSITDAAMRKLAESNVIVGFCGSGGSPVFSANDYCFISPTEEYGPTEYAQKWCKFWFDDSSRLLVAKKFLQHRIELTQELNKGWQIPQQAISQFKERISQSTTTQDLLLAEAHWVKGLYIDQAIQHKISFSRTEVVGPVKTRAGSINGFLNHGNYLAYGYAAASLHILGIPYSFPVLHGKTRRGALVFDLADPFKDAVVLPLAFQSAMEGDEDKMFRARLIQRFQDIQVIDRMIDLLKSSCEIFK